MFSTSFYFKFHKVEISLGICATILGTLRALDIFTINVFTRDMKIPITIYFNATAFITIAFRAIISVIISEDLWDVCQRCSRKIVIRAYNVPNEWSRWTRNCKTIFPLNLSILIYIYDYGIRVVCLDFIPDIRQSPLERNRLFKIDYVFRINSGSLAIVPFIRTIKYINHVCVNIFPPAVEPTLLKMRTSDRSKASCSKGPESRAKY